MECEQPNLLANRNERPCKNIGMLPLVRNIGDEGDNTVMQTGTKEIYRWMNVHFDERTLNELFKNK